MLSYNSNQNFYNKLNEHVSVSSVRNFLAF